MLAEKPLKDRYTLIEHSSTLTDQPINSPNDHQLLQQDLNTLNTWAKTWQMKFNVDKCCILQLSKHHHKTTFLYHMSNKPLTVVEQHSYLGIIIDHHLFGDHKLTMYATRQPD